MKTALTFLLIVASLFALFSGEAFATEPAAHGLLLKARGEGPPQPAPLLETDVEIRVTGHVARAKVTQRFLNPHADWYEGVYVFPLPENAAVDRLRMTIGERLVEGEVREKEQAKKTYAEAKTRGPARRPARAGAAQHLHLERSQHRPGRGDPRRDRVPADAALRPGALLAALPDGGRAALHAGQHGPRGRGAHQPGRAAPR